MKTGNKGLKLIEKFEGLILQAYDDYNDKIVKPGQKVRGTLTIGYGHTTAAGPPKVYVGMKVKEDEADKILAADLASVEIEVEHLVKVSLNQNQFDALVSFQFNTGGLRRASILTCLNAKDYEGAAQGFLKWVRGNGKVLPGLVKRRNEEKALFEA